jgi:hypothetical protein
MVDSFSTKSRSFTDVSLTEAVARRVQVMLMVKPVRPSGPSRLYSRLLGAFDDGRLVLDVPVYEDRKVFLPVGWDLGISFALGSFCLQARSEVLEHCLYPIHPTRRVDALVAQRPERFARVDRRRHPRKRLDPATCVLVSFWPMTELTEGIAAPAVTGRLVDCSPDGLGVRLEEDPKMAAGTEVLVRLEQTGADQSPIMKAVLKHVSEDVVGLYLAGFGELAEVNPGEGTNLIESILRRPEGDVSS